MMPDRIAAEYGLTEAQVKEAFAVYKAHRSEIDADLASEQAMEKAHV